VSDVERPTGDRDPGRVRDEMIALKEPERRKRAQAAQKGFEQVVGLRFPDRPSAGWQAAALEWLGTATARKIASEYWRIGHELRANPAFGDDVYAVLAARGSAFFEVVARGLLRDEAGWGSWPLVRRAVRERVIEPPEGEDYLRRFVTGVGWSIGITNDVDTTYLDLLADPSLLDDEVWRLFEVDLGSELTSATTWAPRDPTDPGKGYGPGENRWLHVLARLASEQRLDRQRMLDASLDALLRDFRASTVGWYAKLHEALEPTTEERVARVDRYLSLVTSPTPAVVKEGLASLRMIEDAVPPDAFARVAPTPFSQRQKNLSTDTLSLLARLCKLHPEARPQLLDAAAQALGHERTDVQGRALMLLEQHSEDAPRAAVLMYVDVVSPTLRPRVRALTGVEAPVVNTAPIALSEIPRRSPDGEGPREPEPIEPIGSVDELIEVAAMLVEGEGDGDDCERFLDGVSRMCDQRSSAIERRTAGLAKRVERPDYWGSDAAGAELIAYVVRAWTRRLKPDGVHGAATVMGFLARRADEVARRAASGRARPLLALPTHRGGFVDPAVLDERLTRTGRLFNRPDPLDRAQAQARALPPAGPLDYARRVREDTRGGMTIRDVRLVASAVPSGLGELGRIAEHAGAADHGKRAWYGSPIAWAGFDRLGSRWALTVLPSVPDVAFAGAATLAVAARDASDTSAGHPEAPLEMALDRDLALTPTAWLTVAACLVLQAPRVTRVAVDLLVASAEDGRCDAHRLGSELAWLLDNDLAKATRLEAPLREVARVSPLHAARTLGTIESLLAGLGSRPHGLHVVLDVAAECSASTGRRIDDERARSTLRAIADEASPSSKRGRLARSLLEP
jgi:Family of unknown function (DUF6493)